MNILSVLGRKDGRTDGRTDGRKEGEGRGSNGGESEKRGGEAREGGEVVIER